MTRLNIKVEDLLIGDEFHDDEGRKHYEVISSPIQWPDVTTVRVRFADGGTGTREWDHFTPIAIHRDEA